MVTKIEELAGPGRIIHRPDGFYDPEGDVPEAVVLKFVKPPQLTDLSDEEYRQEIAHRVATLCEEARNKRIAENRQVVGRAAILAVDHEAKPRRKHPFGALRPRVACKIVALRIAVLQWLKGFRAIHRFARQRFDGGDRGTEFPLGTFLHRRRYGVSCSSTGPPEPAWT